MITINLLGGPGSGKSTLASGLFYYMKTHNMEVEMATEYAREMVYEKRTNILDDQLYILAKQNRRLQRLKDANVPYAITDSPLLMGLIYTKPGYLESFTAMVLECFNQYDNINIFLRRKWAYQTLGRVQKDVNEAISFDHILMDLLSVHKIPFIEMESSDEAIKQIIELLPKN